MVVCKIKTQNPYEAGPFVTSNEVTDIAFKIFGEKGSREINFLTKSALEKKARTGEDLLGLYENAQVYLEETPKGVSELVFRHELMHKIYNEYLTTEEQNVLRRYFNNSANLNAEQFDELLADTYAKYHSNKYPDFIQKIFNVIKKLVNFLTNNKNKLTEFFDAVDNGKYANKQLNHDPGIRRTLNSLLKEWGSVDNYNEAYLWTAKLINNLSLTTTSDSNNPVGWILQTGINRTTVRYRATKDEVLTKTQQAINYLVTNIDAHLAGDNPITASVNKLQKISTLLLDDSNKLATLSEEGQNTLLAGALSYLKPLQKKSNFTNILNRLYKVSPNIIEDSDSVDVYDPFAEDADIADTVQKLQEHIFDNGRTDKEESIREDISAYLSSIYYKDNDGVTVPLDKRVAHALSVLMFRNAVSSSEKFSEQVKYNVDIIGSKAGKAVFDAWSNLRNKANSNTYIHDNKIKTFPTARFLNKNTFIVDPVKQVGHALSIDNVHGIHSLSELNKKRANADMAPVITITRGNQSTIEFFDIISSANVEHSAIGALWDKANAANLVAEIETYYGSQREINYYLGNEKGYIKAQTLGYAKAIALNIENGLVEFIDGNYKNISPFEWQNLKQKLANVNTREAGLKDFLALIGVNNIYFEGAFPQAVIGKPINDILHGIIPAIEQLFNNRVDDNIATTGIDQETNELVVFDGSYVASQYKTLFNTLADAVANNLDLVRSSSILSLDNKKRYKFANASTGYSTLDKVANSNAVPSIGYVKNPHVTLPEHLQSEFYQQNILVGSKIGALYEVVDHDGLREEDADVAYENETDELSKKRIFDYGFTQFYAAHSKDYPRYVQFLPPLGDRNRAIGGVVKLLTPAEQKKAFGNIFRQIALREDQTKFLNYNKYSLQGLDVLGTVLVSKGLATTKNNIAYLTKEAFATIKASPIEVAASVYIDYLAEIEKHAKGISIPVDTKLFDAFIPSEIATKNAGVAYLLQHSLNGYFLNQLTFGDLAQYKSHADLLKRASIAFSPGERGKVGDGFMNQYYKVAILEDLRLNFNELSSLFKEQKGIYDELFDKAIAFAKSKGNNVELKGESIIVNETEFTKDEFGEWLNNTYPNEVGVEITDGQSFITPQRLEELKRGFGEGYNFGNVLKPIHFGPINKDGTPINAILKESSVVLTDELVNTIPVLRRLRDRMLANDLQEVVFATGVKTGNVTPAGMSGSGEFAIKSENTLSLSNEDYRLQLNPKSDIDSKVSLPTQMTYFPNLSQGNIGKNEAKKLYVLYDKLFSLNNYVLDTTLVDRKTGTIKKQKLIDSIGNTPGNELIADLLQEGVSFDLPAFAKRLFYSVSSFVTQNTVKVKFRGTKLVLQSSFGVGALSETDSIKANRLQYKIENGRLVAEVLVSRQLADLLAVEQGVGKNLIGSFVNGDAFGFRIPSTGLHSGVALKVVGYYDAETGNNVVVAPAEIVPIQGLDFDVDSMFVIRRTLVKDIPGASELLNIEGNVPLGYKRDRLNNNYTIYNTFEERIKTLIKTSEPQQRLLYAKILTEFYKNQIVDTYLNIITSPESFKEMVKPISMKVLDDAITSPELKHLDVEVPSITDVYGQFKAQALVRAGRQLTGAFANLGKTYSYLANAGTNGFPKLNPKLVFQIGDILYDRLSLTERTSEQPVIDTFDTLINASIDNLKELKLELINANATTVNFYGALLMMGVDLKTTIAIMTNSKMKTLISGRNFNAKLTEAVPQVSLKGILSESADLTQLYLRLKQISSDLFDVTNTLNLLQQMPYKPELISRVDNSLEKLGKIFDLSDSADLLAYNNALEQYNKNKKLPVASAVSGSVAIIPNEDFSLDLSNLFRNQPNLKAAFRVYNNFKRILANTFYKYSPEVNDFVNQAGAFLNRKADITPSPALLEQIRDEYIIFLSSAIYPEVNNDTFTFTDRNGVIRDLTGGSAWLQTFTETFEANSKKYLAEGKGVKFFSSIGNNPLNGLSALHFMGGGNMKTLDYLALQESFEELKENGEYTQFQKDFLKYSVLTTGSKLATSAIMNVIPPPLYAQVSKKFDQIVEDVRGQEDLFLEQFMLQFLAKNTDLVKDKKPKGLITTKTKRVGVYGFEIDVYEGKADNLFYDASIQLRKSSDFAPEVFKIEFSTYIKVGAQSGIVYYKKINSANPVYSANIKNDAASFETILEPSKYAIPVKTLVQIPTQLTVDTQLSVGDSVYFYAVSDIGRNNKVYGTVNSVTDTGNGYAITLSQSINDVSGFEQAKVGNTDPNVRAKYFKDSDTVKANKILGQIAVSDHPLNKLAAKLLTYADIANVDVTLIPKNELWIKTPSSEYGVAALYQTKNNVGEIQVAEFANFRGKGVEQTLLHEIIHSYTRQFIRENKKANDSLRKLLNHIKEHNSKSESPRDLYELTNIDEFIVGTLSDQNFIDFLKTVPSINNNTSIFEDIINFILELFGISKNQSLYDDAYKVAIETLETAKERAGRVGMFSIDESEVNYTLKAVDILLSDRAKQIFDKGNRNNWTLDRILTELQISKEQKELIFDVQKDMSYYEEIPFNEQLAFELVGKYSFVVKVDVSENQIQHYKLFNDNHQLADTAEFTDGEFIYTRVRNHHFKYRIVEAGTKNAIRSSQYPNLFFIDEGEASYSTYYEFTNALSNSKYTSVPTQYYANLTVPGGANYRENEIVTPLIMPSIKGHAQFSTDKGIGWFRSDDEVKGDVGGSENVVINQDEGKWIVYDTEIGVDITAFFTKEEAEKHVFGNIKTRRILEVQSDLFQKSRDKKFLAKDIRAESSDSLQELYGIGIEGFEEYNNDIRELEKKGINKTENQFLQLLNKNNNWVTFFIKSIVQDSAKKGYEKVLFPSGNTASKVEGHTTLEEFKKQKEDRIKKLESILKENKIIDYTETNIDNIQMFVANDYAYKNNKDGSWRVGRDGRYSNISKEEVENAFNNLKNKINEIKQLKQELERIETEGFGALKPIYTFYENVVTNILNKTYGKDNIKRITDQYGNTWNEVTIDLKRDLTSIKLQTVSKKEKFSNDTKGLNYTVKSLNKRFNLKGKVVTNEQIQKIVLEDVGEKVNGFIKGYTTRNGTVYINGEYHTDDTPFHEVGHLFLAALRKSNPELYNKLVDQFLSTGEGQEYLNNVKAHTFYSRYYSPESQIEEAMVQSMGINAAGMYYANTDFYSALSSIWEAMLELIHSLFDGTILNILSSKKQLLDISDLSFATIEEIAEYLAKGNGQVNLGSTFSGGAFSIADDLHLTDVSVEYNQHDEPLEIKHKGNPVKSVHTLVHSLGRGVVGFESNPVKVRQILAENKAKEMFNQATKSFTDRVILPNGKSATYEETIEFNKTQLERGLFKSRIIHKLIEHKLSGNPVALTEANTYRAKLGRLNAFDWLEDQANMDKLLDKSKLSRVIDGATDNLHFNTEISNGLLGGDVVDLLVEHTDKTYSIVNFQTGSGYSERQYADLFQYGNREVELMNTPEGRAKARVMLDAMIIKLQKPDAAFRMLKVIHVTNEQSLNKTDHFSDVEVEAYLGMFRDYFINENPTAYTQLITAVPTLFSAAQYTGIKQSLVQVAFDNKVTLRSLADKKKAELNEMVMLEKYEGTTPALRKNIEELTQEIFELEKNVGITLALNSQNALTFQERWFGAFEDFNDPYLQTFKKISDKHFLNYQAEYQGKVIQFRRLLKAAVPEVHSENWLRDGFKVNDPEKIFGWMFTDSTIKNSEGEDIQTRDLISKRDAAYDVQVNTKAKREFIEFVKKNFKEGFDIFKSAAFTNKHGKAVSHLNLAEKSIKHTEGFFPRVPITGNEMRKKYGFLSVEYRDYLKAKLLTDYFNQEYENIESEDFGLPVKYLGSLFVNSNPDMYSINVELAFNKFMSATLAKKHLDSVYSVGMGLMNVYKHAKGPNNKELFAPTMNFLRDKINLDLLNKPTELHRGWVIGNYKGKTLRLSYFQLVKTLKSVVSASVMWINPVGSGINTAAASLLTIKEGLKGSVIGSGLIGVDKNTADFTLADLTWGAKEWSKLQGDYMIGNQRNNKTHLLLRKFDYLPTMFDWAVREEHLYTANMPFVNQSTFYILHTAPEEAIATIIMLAQLRNMKINRPGTVHHGKSVFDMYDVVDGELVWKDGLVRGVLEDGERVTELTSQEVQKMYRVYQRIHGGYRGRERTPIEAYALGQLAIQFKRWLPGMWMANLKRKGKDVNLGQYNIVSNPGDDLRQLPGEPTIRWVSRVSEGRWKVLGYHFLNALRIVNNPEYKWKNLSEEQKAGLLDAYITFAMWAGLFAGNLAMFADDDDEDSIRKSAFTVMNRATEFYNPLELYNNIKQVPPVIDRAVTVSINSFVMAGAIVADAAGYEELATTQRGDYKGKAELIKSIPLMAQWYRINKFVNNSEDLESFFNKYR